ncbi:DUF2975 domain-containing protein [Flavobacterium sp.]|jgi:hypothetical protein|uniref:DUF2975 domain-containing protein n=1 Tax=Flavobacterium sp. TaxID=239 RepID=UPI002A83AC6E|nr:DUF2975 domain-containing protein [Flavobacterium sp.]
MKKLNLLKGIIDFVWLLTITSIPFIILFIGYIVFFSEEFFPIKVNGTEITANTISTKILLFSLTIAYILLVYCIYLFRKILRLFQQRKIFDLLVIGNFNKMGYLLLFASIIGGVSNFIVQFMKNKITLEISLNPYVLMFCMGLFLLVLSEVFKIAKSQKEENELTV